VKSEFTAWHGSDFEKDYKTDKLLYCQKGLEKGKAEKVQSVFGLGVAPSGDPAAANKRCAQLIPSFKMSFGCAWV